MMMTDPTDCHTTDIVNIEDTRGRKDEGRDRDRHDGKSKRSHRPPTSATAIPKRLGFDAIAARAPAWTSTASRSLCPAPAFANLSVRGKLWPTTSGFFNPIDNYVVAAGRERHRSAGRYREPPATSRICMTPFTTFIW
jgi:hypothetical protein